MKTKAGQVPVPFFTPPEGTPTISQRLSVADIRDQLEHGPHWPQDHDRRPAVAAAGMLQRLRSRLMQPATAVDSHVRVHRRSRNVGMT